MEEDDGLFPELPPHIHYLVKHREFGLECRRCGNKGSSTFFKTFRCPFEHTVPLESLARDPTGQLMEADALGSDPVGSKKDSGEGIQKESPKEQDENELAELELELLEMQLLEQQLEEIEIEELESEMMKTQLEESTLQHELEMQNQVAYPDDKERFDPCAKMLRIAAVREKQELEVAEKEEEAPKKEDRKTRQPEETKGRPPASPLTSSRLPVLPQPDGTLTLNA